MGAYLSECPVPVEFATSQLESVQDMYDFDDIASEYGLKYEDWLLTEFYRVMEIVDAWWKNADGPTKMAFCGRYKSELISSISTTTNRIKRITEYINSIPLEEK